MSAPATKQRPMKATDEPRLAATHAELREAIRHVFYPAVPTWDVDGQQRVDRATRRVLDTIEAGR